MRLVAVSIVKNEADIIEAFVRHSLAWVDRHLVFDHDSTDGTREILQALRAEGLRVELFTDDALGNLQQARSNHLVRHAATEVQADWILPLDADEILTGPGRPELEKYLAALPPDQPASLPLLNYYPTAEDDPAEANPVLRLRHCQRTPSVTRKVVIPRALALDPGVAAGKGSHVLLRGDSALPDRPLPPEFHLAHLALRSLEHQALRVVLAELQKLSRGSAHAGLDLHYRLGFQLLAEDPDLFFATTRHPAAAMRVAPIAYRGGPLRYSAQAAGWNRVARALLPYLEKLAASHGRLLDAAPTNPAGSAEAVMRELAPGDHAPPAHVAAEAFAGFTAAEGFGPTEGPVPEAFLPPFHWGYAPQTRLVIDAPQARHARLAAEMLTYSEGQAIAVEVNGTVVHQQALPRINQKEWLQAPLPLRAGRNEVTLRYATALVAAHDPRQLAVIFLSLRVLPS
jgi:hypothetical protein